MKINLAKISVVAVAALFLSVSVMEVSAHARAGGGRSYGSRGSRSYSRPAMNYSQPGQSRQQMSPAPTPLQQPQRSGGFLRSMAGGLMGGLLGGMLFSSLGFAGGGGMGGSGIGLIQILILAGIGYLIYRFIRKRRSENPAATSGTGGYGHGTVIPASYRYESSEGAASGSADEGLAHIRRMDPGFDEARFNDTAMDLFFKIQGAWMHRDLGPVNALVTDEMRRILQGDLDRLLREGQINRLENIAVRKVEIAEAWQESGQDYLTALIHANLLDYTTDERTGDVVSGSKSDPVKFEEFWTFTRQVGNNPWRLCAVNQQ